jgi:hypothetical protein
MDDTSEDDTVIKEEKKPIKRCIWPFNVIDLRAFSKKKKDDTKGTSRWESEGGHL